MAPELAPEDAFRTKASILAEFSKIIVIGTGFFHQDEQKKIHFRVKTFTGESEQEVLLAFKKLVEERFDQKKLAFVAHNGRDFDFPCLCRRLLINGLSLPKSLQLLDKKPWEVPHHDTMQMWRFGESRHYVSLELLSAIFDIPSSKTDIDGSQVSQLYHEEGQLARIADYCAEDVIATAQVFLRMNNLPLVPLEQITRVE